MRIQNIYQKQISYVFKKVDTDLLKEIKKNPALALLGPLDDYYISALTSNCPKSRCLNMYETIKFALIKEKVPMDKTTEIKYCEWLNKLKVKK